MLDRYVDAASNALAEVAATHGPALEEAARRAGGLACAHPILDPALSPAAGLEVGRVERAEGRAAAILAGEDLRPGEVADHNAALMAPYADRARPARPTARAEDPA
jgi:hypothetical protein